MTPWFMAVAIVLIAALTVRIFMKNRAPKADQRFMLNPQRPGIAPATPQPADPALQDRLLHLSHGDASETHSLLNNPPRAAAAFHATGMGSTVPASDASAAPLVGAAGPLFSRLEGIVTADNGGLRRPEPEELPIANEDMLFGALTPALAQLLPESVARRTVQRKNLAAAGYHSRASWLNLTALRFVLAFLALIIVGFWLLMAPPQFENWLLALVVIAPLLMWALPPLIVAARASDRKIDIERGLPNVLDMLNMGVSQGLTVPASLRRIASEIGDAHPALSQELAIVGRQAHVGSLSQALRSLSQRIDSPEVASFTSLLIQSEATGTSISRALADYSDSMRNSLRERADARANSASFKLLFPVSLCLMPSVFLFLLGPAIVKYRDFASNQGPQLNQDRQDALNSLDQSPQLDLSQFQQNAF